MDGMIMTAQLLLSLSILIVVHEWGHYITARMFSIKVEKFYLFFDFLFPMANVLNFSLIKFKKGDTEFGLGWFPLGGYVKIAGMVDESMDKEQLKAAPEPWEFRSKPAWQRLIVMLGGVIVNVVVGIIIFIAMTYFIGDVYTPNKYVNEHGGIYALELGQKLGLKSGDKIVGINGHELEKFDDVTKPDVLLSDNSYYSIIRGTEELKIPIPANFIENFDKKEAGGNFVLPRTPSTVDGIKEGSVAARSGLKVGDVITEINGQPTPFYDEASSFIKAFKGDTLQYSALRNGERLNFKEYYKGQSGLGFYHSMIIPKEDLVFIKYSLGESVILGPGRAFEVITVQLKAFKKLLTGAISAKKSLSGPIGMAKAYGSTWDWERFWRMTGLLSMVLAFMNLLPIPALDGGYVMFLLYEMISGKEPSEKFFETAIKVGMAMLLVLMVFVFYNDIAKMFGG